MVVFNYFVVCRVELIQPCKIYNKEGRKYQVNLVVASSLTWHRQGHILCGPNLAYTK
jgi:hypothetical protein